LPSIIKVDQIQSDTGNIVIPSGNVNIDSGLLFVDGTNNRVGVGGVTNPSVALDINGGVFVRGSTNPGSATNRVVIDYNGNSGQATISANSTSGDTQLVFSTSKSGSNANRLSISQDGYVTIPSQPALLAQPNASTFTPVVAPSGGTIFGWNASGGIRYNRGFTIGASSGTTSNFVASGATTGRITVPSAGVYLVMFDQRNEGQVSSGTASYGNDLHAGQMSFWLNGSQIIRRHVNQWTNYPYNHMIIHATLNLNANDYLEFGAWWNSGPGAGGTWSGTGDTVNWLHIVKIA